MRVAALFLLLTLQAATAWGAEAVRPAAAILGYDLAGTRLEMTPAAAVAALRAGGFEQVSWSGTAEAPRSWSYRLGGTTVEVSQGDGVITAIRYSRQAAAGRATSAQP